jgi:hypothetical protein
VIHIGNVAAADQCHADARVRFDNVRRRADQLRAEGLGDDAKIVAQLVGEIGVPLVGSLGNDDDRFWSELWMIVGALAFAATEKDNDG